MWITTVLLLVISTGFAAFCTPGSAGPLPRVIERSSEKVKAPEKRRETPKEASKTRSLRRSLKRALQGSLKRAVRTTTNGRKTLRSPDLAYGSGFRLGAGFRLELRKASPRACVSRASGVAGASFA
jgi:hypothetical protein